MLNKYGRYLVTGPCGGLLYDLYKQKSNSNQSVHENVIENESERISEIIVSARQQGLSEITVEVSKDFADKLSMGGSIPIEGINISAEAKAKSTGNGKVLLSLKLNPDDTYLQIEKLARLHQDGILTDCEFSAAKQRLIEKL
ncbi:SHOCT domain-containing protein [Photobacterium damselae]|uniref:SHOCT domain-containing protein n=1 Tax=Photobacterium damselae TaxID=38293 RepID=UPI002543FA4F